MNRATSIRNIGLCHVALRVRSVEASKRFYRDLFGLRPVWEPDERTAYLSGGRDNLALHQTPEIENAASEAQRLDHIGFLVATPEEVYEAADLVRERGIAFVNQPKEHRDGSHSFYIADPDGNVVQILYEPNISPQE